MERPCDIIYDEEYKDKQDLDDAIGDYIQDHKGLRLIIFIIPKFDELYSNIKFISEITYGVVTQCVSQEKNRQFAQMSYVSNLFLKINAKLGGSNTHLNADCKVGHLKKKTMIMGLDVTHPGFVISFLLKLIELISNFFHIFKIPLLTSTFLSKANTIVWAIQSPLWSLPTTAKW
jgi:hypothetical protein